MSVLLGKTETRQLPRELLKVLERAWDAEHLNVGDLSEFLLSIPLTEEKHYSAGHMLGLDSMDCFFFPTEKLVNICFHKQYRYFEVHTAGVIRIRPSLKRDKFHIIMKKT